MAAKQLVSINDVAIDMPAGPSEVLVVTDKSSNPAFVASDLLSQAEHGADSQVVLLTDSDEIVENVLTEIEIQLNELPRAATAKKALEHSIAIVIKNANDSIDLINEYAPEHLIISTKDPMKIGEKVINAGSFFLGGTHRKCRRFTIRHKSHFTYKWLGKGIRGINLDSFLRKLPFRKLQSKD